MAVDNRKGAAMASMTLPGSAQTPLPPDDQIGSPGSAAPVAPPKRWPGTPIVIVLLVLGLAAAAFGVFRLTAEDSELARLDDELAALEADTEEAAAAEDAAQEGSAAVIAAAEDLDVALVAMADALEVYAEAEHSIVLQYNLAWETSTNVDELAAAMSANVKPAAQEAKTALDTLLQAFADAQASMAELRSVLDGEGS
jgi:hypothetical protein